MDRKQMLAESERVPEGFVPIGIATHPRARSTSGMLARNRATGQYVLVVNGALKSVPHQWAAEFAADSGKGSDELQDQCIARMTALGLNPNQVAEQLDGKVSRSHVCDYLTRRSSIGSHKLQYLLRVLGLVVVADKG